MSRIGRHLSKDTRLLLFKALVAPHFDFCSVLFMALNLNEINQLQKLQNRALRCVLRCGRSASVRQMHQDLSLLTVRQRIIYRVVTFIYKMNSEKLPSYISQKFQLANQVHGHHTRHRTQGNYFQTPSHSKRIQQAWFTQGIAIFNRLPLNIRTLQKQGFAAGLNKYILEKF